MSLSSDKVSSPTQVSYQKQKLYIEDLDINESLEIFERDLKAFLSKYGTIIDIKILMNQQQKHYAFVTFEDDESVELLLAMKLKFKGTELKICRARKPKVKKANELYVKGATKIFVGAIPSKVTLEEFREYFEQYGPIDDICLPMKNKGKSINRGHGFVNYVHALSAKLAIDNYKNHYLRAKWVEVRLAKPRNATSPNFKAYSTIKTAVSPNRTDVTNNIDVSVTKGHSPYPDFLTPVGLRPNKDFANENRSYFSLGNTFYSSTGKNSYTDRLNNFVQRFSQELILDPKQKLELLSYKKRLSLGTSKLARPSICTKFNLNRYERINEGEELDFNPEMIN